MASRRNLGYLLLIVVASVLPTFVSLGWFFATRNPRLRPRAITPDSLRSYAAATGHFTELEIVAKVEWVPGRTGGYTKHRLKQALSDSFRAKGAVVRLEFVPGGKQTQVTYLVGSSALGPFTLDRAALGIGAAVEAFRMFPVPAN